MFVADADGHRNRHDTAEHRRPVCDNEIEVRLREDDEFVARLHAAGLQRAQQRQRAVPQSRERNDGLMIFTVDEADRSIPASQVVE